jgi:hypothetical protein
MQHELFALSDFCSLPDAPVDALQRGHRSDDLSQFITPEYVAEAARDRSFSHDLGWTGRSLSFAGGALLRHQSTCRGSSLC